MMSFRLTPALCLGLFLGIFACGCLFSPTIGNGQVHCGADGSCPPGFSCGSDSLCYSGSGSTTPVVDGGVCSPLHCYVGWCGPIDDGCGHTIDCGSCSVVNDGSVDVSHDLAGCTPTRACTAGVCGTLDDGCGKALACGDCAKADTCSATTAHSCSCTPRTCAGVKATCGQYPDGCGGTLNCQPAAGSCLQQKNGLCGGGGPYTCGKTVACHPLKACPAGACGDIPDGCLSILHCGNCATGQVCGGAGTANVCG
jgi:hypothetical protein